MKKNKLVFITIVLVLISSGAFYYKFTVLNFPLFPKEKSDVWDIEVRISFTANPKKPSKVNLFIPNDSKKYTIISENFFSGKYGLITEKKNGNRAAKWSIRKAKGRQNLYYQATIQKISSKSKRPKLQKQKPVIAITGFKAPFLETAKKIWNSVYEQSSDLDTVVGNLFKKINSESEEIKLLLEKGRKSRLKKIKLAIKLLSLSGIPARIVHGFDLNKKVLKIKSSHWLEVFHKKRWVSFDPLTGERITSDNYIVWWKGDKPLFKVTGGKKAKIFITAQVNEELAVKNILKKSKATSPAFIKFSLQNLPLQNQMVYRVLLLIPLGALLVVLFRNIIGVKTFGTFMPVLIALSFRETDILLGTVFFSIVVALGLSVRFMLEKLKLLVVPRLSAVLIAVIIIIALINIISSNMGLSLGLSVSLFPIVILVMTIERMSIIWEERGPVESLQQGIGTLFVAAVIFFIINIKIVEHFMFFFPETLLFILAIIILMGRYSGFRLTELYRFKELK